VHVDRYMHESCCYRESIAIPSRRLVGVDSKYLVAICGACVSSSVHCANLISLSILMDQSLEKCGMKAVDPGNSAISESAMFCLSAVPATWKTPGICMASRLSLQLPSNRKHSYTLSLIKLMAWMLPRCQTACRRACVVKSKEPAGYPGI
jgi:hypothetical protein